MLFDLNDDQPKELTNEYMATRFDKIRNIIGKRLLQDGRGYAFKTITHENPEPQSDQKANEQSRTPKGN